MHSNVRINDIQKLKIMKILLEAQDKVKFIEGNDFEELKTVLEKIRVKYDVKIEIRNFMVDYKDNDIQK